VPALREPFQSAPPSRLEFRVFANQFFQFFGNQGADGRATLGGYYLDFPNSISRKLESEILSFHTDILARKYVQHALSAKRGQTPIRWSGV